MQNNEATPCSIPNLNSFASNRSRRIKIFKQPRLIPGCPAKAFPNDLRNDQSAYENTHYVLANPSCKTAAILDASGPRGQLPPMRILHVTDFHFNKTWFAWLSAQAPSFDACCLTGDFHDMLLSFKVGQTTTLGKQARWIKDWLQDFPGPFFACSGNHDWNEDYDWSGKSTSRATLLPEGIRGKIRIDSASEVFLGHRMVCVPWMAPCPPLLNVLPVVLLSHAPPADSPIAAAEAGCVGDPEITTVALKLPRGSFVLSGHCHNPGTWHDRIARTWCFNPGVNRNAAVPNHIVIDTEEQRATFHGWGVVDEISTKID